VLVAKPENAGTNKSESSGTAESKKGAMTRLRAVTKGKELKAVNKAEDPEAKAKLLRATARQKKEREQKATTDASEQDKDKVEQNNSPQPKPSNTDPQVRSPVVTFKTEASITTPMRSPSTETSSSTPSDLNGLALGFTALRSGNLFVMLATENGFTTGDVTCTEVCINDGNNGAKSIYQKLSSVFDFGGRRRLNKYIRGSQQRPVRANSVVNPTAGDGKDNGFMSKTEQRKEEGAKSTLL